MITPVLKGNCVYAYRDPARIYTMRTKDFAEFTYPETHGEASIAYVFTDDFKTFYTNEVV